MLESKILSLHQKSSKKSLFSQSNLNYLFFSRILQNRIYFINNSIIFSIYSIILIFQSKLQSKSCTKMIVISNQEILIFRFNISSTHQHRSYSFHSKVFQYFIYSSNKSTFVFCLDVKFNIKSSKSYIEHHYIKTFKIHQFYINIRITSLVRKSFRI